MAEFVRVRHPQAGEAVLAVSALKVMRDWKPVDADVEVPTYADGTITQVLTAVGDDPVKAAAALDAEQARPTPRSTLVDALNRIIDEEN